MPGGKYGGEPVSLAAHPRLPDADPGSVLDYEWTWELESSPRQLWPYVSNTERFNRAVGLPAVAFTTKAEGPGRVRRTGRVGKAGVVFASEPRAFFKAGLMSVELDEQAARELIGLNYTLGAATRSSPR